MTAQLVQTSVDALPGPLAMATTAVWLRPPSSPEKMSFDLDETAHRALRLLYDLGSDRVTAVRLARALGLTVPVAQECLTDLECSSLIERPTGSMYPFFQLT